MVQANHTGVHSDTCSAAPAAAAAANAHGVASVPAAGATTPLVRRCVGRTRHASDRWPAACAVAAPAEPREQSEPLMGSCSSRSVMTSRRGGIDTAPPPMRPPLAVGPPMLAACVAMGAATPAGSQIWLNMTPVQCWTAIAHKVLDALGAEECSRLRRVPQQHWNMQAWHQKAQRARSESECL